MSNNSRAVIKLPKAQIDSSDFLQTPTLTAEFSLEQSNTKSFSLSLSFRSKVTISPTFLRPKTHSKSFFQFQITFQQLSYEIPFSTIAVPGEAIAILRQL